MNTSITKSGKLLFLLATAGLLSLSACKKDKLPDIKPIASSTKGVYVLNEGPFKADGSGSPSTISYYNVATNKVEIDYFKRLNGIALGFNANDLKQYGSKMYCVITGTNPAAKDSYLEVIDVATGKSLKRIPFSDAAGGFMPRSVVFDKNKAYISAYDGKVTKLDTASLTIDSRLAVAGALEQMAIVNNKIYVTSSSHPFFPNPNNSSVSVIDLNTFTKIKEIAVSLNPTVICATPAGDLFVKSNGFYSPTPALNIPGAIDKLSSVTDTKLSTGSNLGLTFLAIDGGKGFAIGSTPPTYATFTKAFNTTTGTLGADLITDGTTIPGAYSVTLNNLDKTFFVADGKDYVGNGAMFCFSADGKIKFSFETGIVPKTAVFQYGY